MHPTGLLKNQKIKIWLFQKVKKSQNKVGVAEPIGSKNDITLSRVGTGN